ncbi:MAG TPA: flippase activity-associated protein Agl23 [Verrucomicrobiae bacterium]|nr:flippase activity-associated protein Agl23 [Verrucomicrobiae bacterium]
MANPPHKIRRAIFLALVLLSLAVRLPQLGVRPMHTDESVNAYIVGELLSGKAFHYDPRDRHGPALAALALPLAELQGAKNFSELTESELRLSTVLAGAATVFLFGAGVEMFGFAACFIAALLFAFAPLPVYYNRYFIHESLFVAATLGLICSGWRALEKKSLLQSALAGLCAALMLACKETAPLHYFAMAIALFVCWIFKKQKTLSWNKLLSGFPPLKMISAALAVFLFVTILLFTWFGRNWGVFADLYHAISNFTARAGGEGHQKPFWYYAKLLCDGWSGGIILAVTVLGIFYSFGKNRECSGAPVVSNQNSKRGERSVCRIFLAIYAIAIFVIYSAIPYKTPWLALNFWLPIPLLVGIAIEWFWIANQKIFRRLIVLLVLVELMFSIARDTRLRVFVGPADEKNPYAYAHTLEDLLGLPKRIEELVRQRNLSDPRIAVVAADPWPLPWYLRKFSQVGFWQPGQETGPADFFITTTDVSDKLAERLKTFRPEFFGVRPEVLLILWTPETQRKP